MDASYSKLPSDEKDIEKSLGEDDIYHIVKPSPDSKSRHKCKAKRCIFRCCKMIALLLSAIVLLLGIFGGIVGYKVNQFISVQVQEWTVTEPQTLPVVEVPQSELTAFMNDAESFFEGIKHDRTDVKDMIISDRTLNGFVSVADEHNNHYHDHHHHHHHHHHSLYGTLYTEIKKNHVSLDISLPTDGVPGGKGRFLVGTKTLTWDPESSILHVKMEKGPRTVGLDDMLILEEEKPLIFDFKFYLTKTSNEKMYNLEMIHGQFLEWNVPQDFIDEHINLLEDLYYSKPRDKDCKYMRKFLFGLENIAIKDNQVVLHPRNKPEKKYHHWHGHHDRNLVEEFTPSNRSGWKFHYGRRLVLGF
jgi:hypothetical protein